MTKTEAILELCEEVDGMNEHGGYDLKDVRDAAEKLIMKIDEI